jgi:hypothetical protein
MTGKQQRSFSVLLHVAEKKNSQDEKELINFETVSIKYYKCVSVLLP